MFRTQRFIILAIAGSFIVILIILSVSAHHQLGILNVGTTTKESLYSKLSGGFGAVLDADREREADAEEAARLAEKEKETLPTPKVEEGDVDDPEGDESAKGAGGAGVA